jgi:hypothetical protein
MPWGAGLLIFGACRTAPCPVVERQMVHSRWRESGPDGTVEPSRGHWAGHGNASYFDNCRPARLSS